MAKTSFPFNSTAVYQADWSKMAEHWRITGILKNELNSLEVYADSTGMQVKVKSGKACVKGFYFESDAVETLSLSAANASNPRYDLVILRLDTANENIDLAVLEGTPAGSPTAPTLTQSGSIWEIALAKVTVGAGVSTIASDKVSDERSLSATPGQVFDTLKTIGISALLGNTKVVLETGLKGWLEIPFNCVISGCKLVSNAAGSCVIDIWKVPLASVPPSSANTICGGAKPTLSSSQKSITTITAWNKTVSAGDILYFNVDSASTLKQVTVMLTLIRGQ